MLVTKLSNDHKFELDQGQGKDRSGFILDTEDTDKYSPDTF